MKVLTVEPGKIPYETEIAEGLKPLQNAVGGEIEAVYPFDAPVALVCHGEGKLIGLPLNRALEDEDGNMYDIVAGTFLVVGLGEEDFADLPDDLMAEYKARFYFPERFARTADHSIVVIKQMF